MRAGKGKSGLIKKNIMSRYNNFTGWEIIALVTPMRRRVTQKDTRSGARLEFMDSSREEERKTYIQKPVDEYK